MILMWPQGNNLWTCITDYVSEEKKGGKNVIVSQMNETVARLEGRRLKHMPTKEEVDCHSALLSNRLAHTVRQVVEKITLKSRR